MSNAYQKLIYEKGLYREEFIQLFGVEGKHWNESDQKRELALRHNMCCLLMCNTESIELRDLSTDMSERIKRYRELEQELEEEQGREKVARVEDYGREGAWAEEDEDMQEQMPSTSKNATSSSSGRRTKAIVDSILSTSSYRFIMLEGVPSAVKIQNQWAETWGLRPTDKQWDLIDLKEKKFIELKVSGDKAYIERAYMHGLAYSPQHTALVEVLRDGSCRWRNHGGFPPGEQKVQAFMLQRRLVIDNLQILESDTLDIPLSLENVFPNEVMNSFEQDWRADWLPNYKDLQSIMKNKEELSNKLDCITADVLIGNLDDLEKSVDRPNVPKWRGKLLPEGFVLNFNMPFQKDDELISAFLGLVKSEGFNNFITLGYTDEALEKLNNHENVLQEILEWWDNSNKSPFTVKMANKVPKDSILGKMMGIKMKGTVFNMDNETAVQKDFGPIPKCHHDSWFDEVFRRMTKPHGLQGVPLAQLLEPEMPSTHPIAKASDEGFRHMMKVLTKCNASVMASKIQGVYSRLGGAYIVTESHNTKTGQEKTSHNYIAYMPIYTPLRDPEDPIKVSRAVSGVLIRGPHHARNATDRIQIMTIEMMKYNIENVTLLRKAIKCLVYYNDNNMLVIRQNSIIREDPSYLNFISNAYFLPANLLGVMTLEDPKTGQEGELGSYIKGVAEACEEWLTDRFVDGVMMATIGNARDEGYMGVVRKLFMVTLNMRRRLPSGNLSIVKFCEKVNETLIDNPFSFYIHRTMLRILSVYLEQGE